MQKPSIAVGRVRICMTAGRSADLADNDVRHNFIGSWVYDLPVGKGRPLNIANSLLNAVAGGWQVNGIANFRSGMPYTISYRQ